MACTHATPGAARARASPVRLRSDYWPDAWKVEQMSAKEPTLEERMRSGPPPHVVELMNLDRPPTTDPDQE